MIILSEESRLKAEKSLNCWCFNCGFLIITYMVLGIDVGGTTIKFGLVKLNGKIVTSRRIDTQTAAEGEGVIETMITETKKFLAEHSEIEGVGIGFPGLLSKDRESVILMPNIPQLQEVNVIQKFKEAIPSLPVAIENDAKCAALGELDFGEAKAFDNYLLITLGTGVGGGLILDGELFLGARGNATEIGHMLTPSGKTVEQQLGLNQIVAYAKQQLSVYEGDSILKGKELTPKDISEAAEAGDVFAKAVWGHVGVVLGQGIVSMIRFADVTKFVLGGGVAGAFDLFIEHTYTTIKEYLPPYYTDDIEIKKASVGEDAGILGAASLIYHKFGQMS